MVPIRRSLGRESEFSLEVARRRSRAELFEIDAVVEDVRFLGGYCLGHVKLARGPRHGQQTPMTVQVGHGLGAQRDDVAQVGDARQLEFGSHRAGESPHRQTVGMQQGRPPKTEKPGQFLAQPALRQAGSIGRAALKWNQFDAACRQLIGQRPFRRGHHRRREPGRPNPVERGQHRPLAAVECGVFAEEEDFRHDCRIVAHKRRSHRGRLGVKRRQSCDCWAYLYSSIRITKQPP